MTEEDVAELGDADRERTLGYLLAIMSKDRVASVICKVYDSDEDVEELTFLISTNDIVEEEF